MKSRCPDAKIIGTSKIKDYRLCFKGDEKGYYLTIEPKSGYTVPVGVWETSKSDEENLDHYENYPILYYKKDIHLEVKHNDNGEIISEKCYIYIMVENKNLGEPTEEYVNTCLQGYRDFGLDISILEKAVEENKNL